MKVILLINSFLEGNGSNGKIGTSDMKSIAGKWLGVEKILGCLYIIMIMMFIFQLV